MAVSIWDLASFLIRILSFQLLKEGFLNFLVFIGVYSRPILDTSTDLSNNRVIVTGGNRGIGKSVVELLAQRKATIVIACRDVQAGLAVAKKFGRKYPQSRITVSQLDLTSLDSVKKFAEHILADDQRVDILINNAGVSGNSYVETVDKLEQVAQVNCFAPILLTFLLSKRLKESHGIVANVSSLGHHAIKKMHIEQLNCFAKYNYNYVEAYSESKTLLMFATKYLNNRVFSDEITCISVDPGASQTGLFDTADRYIKEFFASTLLRPFTRTTEESANSIVQSVLCCKRNGGKVAAHCYMKDGKYVKPSKLIQNHSLEEKVWKLIRYSLGSGLTL